MLIQLAVLIQQTCNYSFNKISSPNIEQVRASAVFIPEASNPGAKGPDTDRYLFAYSIRISLLPQGCMLDGAYYSSCQLRSRHWIIRSKENIVDDVRGEAVIGNVIPFSCSHSSSILFTYHGIQKKKIPLCFSVSTAASWYG